jgi:hypothetical protein
VGGLNRLEGHLLVLNFGSGSARDTLTLSKENQRLAKWTRFDCIDIDSKANERGMKIANEFGIINHRFIEGDMCTEQSLILGYGSGFYAPFLSYPD